MKNDLNLLPKEIASEKVDDRRTINTGLIILIILALGFFIGLPMFEKYNLNKQIKTLTSTKDNAGEEKLKKSLENYKLQVQEIERDKELESIVNKNEMAYKEVLNAIEVSIPKRVKIEGISMSGSKEEINVSVTGTDEVAIADFWNNLRKTKIFDEVNPQGISLSSSDEDGDYEQVYTSTIELVYVQKG